MHRTRHGVTFDTEELIERALSRIRRLETIQPPRVVTTVAEVDFSRAGATADPQAATKIQEMDRVKAPPRHSCFSPEGDRVDPAHAG